MLVGVESSTSRSVGASETVERKKHRYNKYKYIIKGKNKGKYGIHFPTCLLLPSERQALLCAAHSVDADQVFGVWGKPCQGEVVP